MGTPPLLSYVNHFMVTVLIRSKRLGKWKGTYGKGHMQRDLWKAGDSCCTVGVRLRMRGLEWSWLTLVVILIKSFSSLSLFPYKVKWLLILITVGLVLVRRMGNKH